MRVTKLLLSAVLCLIILTGCEKGNSLITLESEMLKLQFDRTGVLKSIVNKESEQNFLDQKEKTPLLSIRINGEYESPNSMEMKEDVLILKYPSGTITELKYEQKETHITLELIKLDGEPKVELITWGPYPTTINKIIGETVGVVRGEEYAIGIQALNIKTLGGYPWNESDRMPQIDIFEQDDPNNLHPEKARGVLYRVEAAKPTETGSSLQAYCRNRSEDRIIQDFNHEKIIAPAYDDGGVIGSKIALFGCPVEKTLEIIGEIEVAEGLPHPVIDGQWGKTAPEAAAAYLIMDFTEDDVEKAIGLTKKAGLRYLYHYGKTFESWGHFGLFQEEFPNGYAGLKTCVEKAGEQGVMIGLHVLSNFITPNDPYVTPVPDKRLAKVGSSIISEDIDATQTEISIESPDFFNQMKNNNMRAVVIGDELIRYGEVSEKAPWILLDCQRGAFETTASAHKSGDKIAKLLDHAYKVFLTNTDLTIELSKNIAELFNQTGLRQISFDGLEGNRSTGMGTYGEALMPYTWYNSLSDDLRRHLIIDASRTTHFFWHIYSRMNWGEPWYAGFRESQTEYRMKNQKYFRRNFMPGMLGWFKMTPETSIEDIEWLLARSAAFDAGYAFVANYESIEKNGNSDEILQLISEWETVRIAGLFSDEQKLIMEDTDNEFSLKKMNNNEWDLYRVYSGKFNHEKKVRQPGEPLYSTFNFNHEGEEQVMNFILNAIDSDISNITMEIDNYKEIKLPVALKTGEIIKYSGGEKAYVYNSNWQTINEFNIDPSAFKVSNGEHSITFECEFMNTGKEPMVKLEIRTFGPAEKITLQ